MMRCVFRPRAQRDIEEIWDCTAKTWGVSQAEIYIRQIQQSLATLADNPKLGRVCDEINPGYRKFRSGSHFVFYRLGEGSIDVVRILHESRDVDHHL